MELERYLLKTSALRYTIEGAKTRALKISANVPPEAGRGAWTMRLDRICFVIKRYRSSLSVAYYLTCSRYEELRNQLLGFEVLHTKTWHTVVQIDTETVV